MGTWHDFCHIHTIHGSTNFWSNYHCAAGTPCWTSNQVVKHTADKLVSHVRALARPMISPYGHLSTARANLRMAVTSCNPVSAVLTQQWNVHFLKLRNFIHRYRWKGIPHRFIFSAQIHTGKLKIAMIPISIGTFYPRCVSAHERTKRTHFPTF